MSKKSHHITNSASFTNCGRLLKKKKKKNWKLKEKKKYTIVLILFFAPTMLSIGIP